MLITPSSLALFHIFLQKNVGKFLLLQFLAHSKITVEVLKMGNIKFVFEWEIFVTIDIKMVCMLYLYFVYITRRVPTLIVIVDSSVDN